MLERFGETLESMRSTIDDLHANFADADAQGAVAYSGQMLIDHPELDRTRLSADAVVAVDIFRRSLFPELL